MAFKSGKECHARENGSLFEALDFRTPESDETPSAVGTGAAPWQGAARAESKLVAQKNP